MAHPIARDGIDLLINRQAASSTPRIVIGGLDVSDYLITYQPDSDNVNETVLNLRLRVGQINQDAK